MPYKANEPRRHKIPRARYKVRNWPEYDRALQQRDSLKKRHTPEEIVSKLRQVDVLVAQGTPVADAIRAIGVTEVG